jgi:hypothetical protein
MDHDQYSPVVNENQKKHQVRGFSDVIRTWYLPNEGYTFYRCVKIASVCFSCPTRIYVKTNERFPESDLTHWDSKHAEYHFNWAWLMRCMGRCTGQRLHLSKSDLIILDWTGLCSVTALTISTGQDHHPLLIFCACLYISLGYKLEGRRFESRMRWIFFFQIT